jgi:hypothetical protein
MDSTAKTAYRNNDPRAQVSICTLPTSLIITLGIVRAIEGEIMVGLPKCDPREVLVPPVNQELARRWGAP